MAYNNTVELIGNIGGEIRFVEDGDTPFAAFSLATADSYQDEQENWVQKATIWHNVLVFNPRIIAGLRAIKENARIKLRGTLSYSEFETLLDDGRVVKKKEASIIVNKLEMATLVPKQAA